MRLKISFAKNATHPHPHQPCSTIHPSNHSYCQLDQFNMLTFPFWQFHSMESDKQTNRSSSSINSYTFSSIGFITSIIFIETIYSVISMPSVQPFRSVLHFQFHFSGTTKTNSLINSINAIREGPKKNGFIWDFVPNIKPHQPTARLWDSTKWKIWVKFILLFRLFGTFYFFEEMSSFSDEIPCIYLGLWTATPILGQSPKKDGFFFH